MNLEIEEKVYDYLYKNHFGKEKLIKNKNLREKFGINSDKAMRKVIQNIRENKNFELIVGSVSGHSGGFYICSTEDEVNDTIDNIRHRSNQMQRTCHILEWKKNRGYDVEIQ